VTVPESLAGGRRVRMAFSSADSAERWIAEKALDAARGEAVAVTARKTSGMAVSELVRVYLSDKQDRIASESFRMLRHRLGKLLDRFGSLPLSEVTPWAGKEWLAGMACAQRTRYGVFVDCRSLWRWALRYDLAETNPWDRMEPQGKGQAKKEILRPDQMASLLGVDWPDWFRAWLVLGAFGGLRTVEIQRLEWSAVHRSRREIFVGADVIKKTKGMRQRFVKILPALLRHLPRHRSGPVVPVAPEAMAHWRRKAVAILEVSRWPQNALRHSFASYHLAMWRDSATTAHEMGHTSTAMVFSNYAQAVTASDARKWWAL